MIVIKVELWPCGSERLRKEIGRMEITNLGKPDASGHKYFVSIHTDNQPPRQGAVLGHDRNSPIWSLIRKALDSVG